MKTWALSIYFNAQLNQPFCVILFKGWKRDHQGEKKYPTDQQHEENEAEYRINWNKTH